VDLPWAQGQARQVLSIPNACLLPPVWRKQGLRRPPPGGDGWRVDPAQRKFTLDFRRPASIRRKHPGGASNVRTAPPGGVVEAEGIWGRGMALSGKWAVGPRRLAMCALIAGAITAAIVVLGPAGPYWAFILVFFALLFGTWKAWVEFDAERRMAETEGDGESSEAEKGKD
jgi:hypothetical protein